MHLETQQGNRKAQTATAVIAAHDPDMHKRIRHALTMNAALTDRFNVLSVYDESQLSECLSTDDDLAVLFFAPEDHQKSISEIREIMDLKQTKVILLITEPARIPSFETLLEQDISDVLNPMTDTNFRLVMAFQSALTAFEMMKKVSMRKKQVAALLDAGDAMLRHQSQDDFLDTLMAVVRHFRSDGYKNEIESVRSGFIAVTSGYAINVMTARGEYEQHVGEDITLMPEFTDVFSGQSPTEWKDTIVILDHGILARHIGKDASSSYIFIGCDPTQIDFGYVHLAMLAYGIVFDNVHLETVTRKTQDEILYLLGKVVETQFEETGGHVRRVSILMSQFAKLVGYAPYDVEVLRLASMMHDIGKIGIPEHILKKPGVLTPLEMDVMRTHAIIGHNILQASDLEVFASAATIALAHHERFDGTGYPNGLAGYDIPRSARMMAIIDVFDAMTHDRVYRKAMPREDVLKHIESERGGHFDPELADIFIKHIDTISGD